MEHKILHGLKSTARYIIIILMFLLVLSMILGTGHLFIQIFQMIVSPDPYPFLINVEDLYIVFSILLIIVVGYELFKSMFLILNNDKIPVKSILKIAAIAMANKVITTNFKHAEMSTEISIGVILFAIGVAYYFFSKDSSADAE